METAMSTPRALSAASDARGDLDYSLFRLSRTHYPGSRFGPKSRYDLPQRRKAYGNADEAEAILFSGSSLQPQTWAGWASGDGDAPKPAATVREATATAAGATPRMPGILTDAARAMLHPLADRNLPELPLLDGTNDAHGILVLGGKGAGKTSLLLSIWAAVSGQYPHGPEIKEKKRGMPAYGQCYQLPSRDIRMCDGSVQHMRLVLTDTPPCGTDARSEQPLCASVSPNSTRHYNAIPSWMRITLRSGNFPHYAVLFVVDATATPLWEDATRCRELARLLAVLKRNQYTVVIGVTKLLKAREKALRDVAYGHGHGNQAGKDPRSSYESYVSRYLDKLCAVLQAKAEENDWSFSQVPESPPFPLVNSTIFDVPSWVNVVDHRAWLDRRGTPELPNLHYYNSQLTRLLEALSARSHPM